MCTNTLLLRLMQKEFSLERTVDLIDGKFDSYALMSLMEYIRIPNLSR